MKKNCSVFAFAAALLLAVFSCKTNNDSPIPDNQDPQEEPADTIPDDTGLKPGVYKLVASPGKGKWQAGDEIYVHGSIGLYAQVVTLSAEDISGDGTVASAFLGEELTGTPIGPDGLYAVFPAAAANQFKGACKATTTFLDCTGLRCAAFLAGDSFVFTDVSAAISFSAPGYDGFALCGAGREGLSGMQVTAEYTSEKSSFTTKGGDGYPFLYGDISSGGQALLWLPGGIKFPKGYTIFLKKGDFWVKSFTSAASETVVSAGEVLELGDITSSLSDYSGPAPVMPRVTRTTSYAVSFNELSGVFPSPDGTFIWGVGDDGDLAKLSLTGEVLYKFHIGGDAEDISINPETGDLLIGLEPDGVGVVKAPDFNARVKTLFSIAAAKNYGNSGLEGLTYYKDGMVFAGTQSNSQLFLCDLATGEVLWDKKLYDTNRVNEIAGLFYDSVSGWLWIITSEPTRDGKVFVYDIDLTTDDNGKYDVGMNYLGAYSVKEGANTESVCIDHVNSCMWVGDDYGSTSYLYRYDLEGLD